MVELKLFKGIQHGLQDHVTHGLTIDFSYKNHLFKEYNHTNHVSNENSFYHLDIYNSLKGNLSSLFTLITKHLV